MYCNKQTGFGIVGTQIIIVSKKEMILSCFCLFCFFELEQSRFREGNKYVLKFRRQGNHHSLHSH